MKWNTPTEPFKVIDNVYYVGTAGLSSFLITSPSGHVLIDTGPAQGDAADQRPTSTSSASSSPTSSTLLNTHAHLDPTGASFAELKKDTGAVMVSSAADKPLLEGGYYPGTREDEAQLEVSAGHGRSHVGQGDTDNPRLHREQGAGEARPDPGVAYMTPGHSPGPPGPRSGATRSGITAWCSSAARRSP